MVVNSDAVFLRKNRTQRYLVHSSTNVCIFVNLPGGRLAMVGSSTGGVLPLAADLYRARILQIQLPL